MDVAFVETGMKTCVPSSAFASCDGGTFEVPVSAACQAIIPLTDHKRFGRIPKHSSDCDEFRTVISRQGNEVGVRRTRQPGPESENRCVCNADTSAGSLRRCVRLPPQQEGRPR